MTANRRVVIGREIWCVVLLVAFAVFVSTTYVTTYLGSRGRGRSQVWAIWRDLTTDLPGGSSDLIKVGYLLIVALFLVSCFFGLWLSLGAVSTRDATDENIAPRSSST